MNIKVRLKLQILYLLVIGIDAVCGTTVFIHVTVTKVGLDTGDQETFTSPA